MKKACVLVASNARKLRTECGKADTVHIKAKPRTRPREPALGADCSELQRLFTGLSRVQRGTNPRTCKLLDSGNRKIAQKVIEEAGEVALEAVTRRTHGVVRESADLLYHLVVLWHRAGIDPDEIWAEMRRRAEAFGIAEKCRKSSKHDRSPMMLRRPPDASGVAEKSKGHRRSALPLRIAKSAPTSQKIGDVVDVGH
jgi:phosphoribosyl-ATP pyrophosphohydrolase